MKAVAWAVALSMVTTMLAWSDPGQRRRKRAEEEITQSLELPKELPSVVLADSERLTFHVSPLSARGLLSQQVRDAVRALMGRARGATIVRLRGFVAGSGDVRRVQAIVSETFSDRRRPLPALSVVRVGALPLDGAQVVLEAVAVAKKAVNPHGLAFVSGQAAAAGKPLAPLGPLAEQSLGRLRAALSVAGAGAKDVLQVTCFLSSLDDLLEVRIRLAREFPQAALNFVQGQRAPGRSAVQCEAVARLREAPGEGVRFLGPPGLAAPPGFSAVTLVGPARLALSGAQLAFGYTEDDARLAFQRLGKSLEQAGAGLERAVVWNFYPMSPYLGETALKVGAEFCDPARPPAGAAPLVEGLGALDAGFAADVVAVVSNR